MGTLLIEQAIDDISASWGAMKFKTNEGKAETTALPWLVALVTCPDWSPVPELQKEDATLTNDGGDELVEAVLLEGKENPAAG